MMTERVLGMPLDKALALLRADGIEPIVVETKAPPRRGAAPEASDGRKEATLRVIRVRGSELTVSRFFDGTPVSSLSNNQAST